MRVTMEVLDAYQCQQTLRYVRDCPCIKCTLWRIELATREQEAVEQRKELTLREVLSVIFGLRIKNRSNQ